MLYPSWIEIPVNDIARATRFYRAVFDLSEVESHELSESDRLLQIVVLSASDKPVKAPGVSLVQSSRHHPSAGGVQINFHVGDHNDLTRALVLVAQHGGTVESPVIDDGEGVRYALVQDSEGNTLALSGYDSTSESN